ncbi:hypothetical protein [Prosthecobacter sp.]|uniref:hypothetical protein n=1 Tax=Prosthecobacter sp. TaxID=1965333 RepID=UPI00378397BD
MKGIRFDLTKKLDAVILAAEEAGLAAHPASLSASFLRDYFHTFQPTDTHASRSLVARKLRALSEPDELVLQLEEKGLLPKGCMSDIRRTFLLLISSDTEEKFFSAIEPFKDTSAQLLWSNRFAETLDRLLSSWKNGRWLDCNPTVKCHLLRSVDTHLNHGWGPMESNGPGLDAEKLMTQFPKGKTAAGELRAALHPLFQEIQREYDEGESSGQLDSVYHMSPESILQLMALSRLSSDERERFRPLDERLTQAAKALDLDEAQIVDSYLSLSRWWGASLPEEKLYQLRFVAAHLRKLDLPSVRGGAEFAEAISQCLEYLMSILGRFAPVTASP